MRLEKCQEFFSVTKQTLLVLLGVSMLEEVTCDGSRVCEGEVVPSKPGSVYPAGVVPTAQWGCGCLPTGR